MNKTEITKNLKQIKKLLEEESLYIAKERIGFLIDEIEDTRIYRSNQGRTSTQIESTYKAIEWSFFGLIITTVLYSLGKALGVW